MAFWSPKPVDPPAAAGCAGLGVAGGFTAATGAVLDCWGAAGGAGVDAAACGVAGTGAALGAGATFG